MTPVLAIAMDLWREAASRRWFLVLGFGLTAFLLAMASSLEIEVVDGALAATRLFGDAVFGTDIRAADVALRPVFLAAAYVIFYGGLELEGRMTDIFVKQARNGKPTFPVSEGISPDKLRTPPEFQGKYDPHIWFDVTLWQEAARTVNSELAKLDPGSKDLYQRNTEAYLKQLDELHQYVTTQAASLPAESRILVTAHDAFGYFGAQYGFEVRGLQGMSTATEAGAGDRQRRDLELVAATQRGAARVHVVLAVADLDEDAVRAFRAVLAQIDLVEIESLRFPILVE